MCAFNLPTGYDAPGQENIEDEDDRIKINIDFRKSEVEDYSPDIIEQVVKGWKRYIMIQLKEYAEKVN